MRFGLVEVDYTTKARTIRRSGRFFGTLADRFGFRKKFSRSRRGSESHQVIAAAVPAASTDAELLRKRK